ncbi:MULTISPECIES: hypothetical protein [Morganellaceae]|uniref:Uncharacterized protein n=1 Tax=Morganella psychrotolerans TaxID=368603 RepID=A0A1B8HMN1_9GAMM|nr:hypothetical protein [Morganella psychrotolerans]OBU10552.1 hypothetical protein AYY17_15525 [Morganella psychrotolerans]
MQTHELVTKAEQLIQRKDGAQAKIVATAMFGTGLHMSVDVFVLRRDNAEQNWQLCSDKPHPDFKTMSREDYVKFGRSEMLRTVTAGELLKVTGMIGQPIANYQ